MKNIDAVYNLKCNKIYEVKWRLTKWCNYNCSYCLQNHEKINIAEKNKELFIQAHQLRQLLLRNIGKYNRNKLIKLLLIGGEIMFFDILQILKILDIVNRVNITSNFSANVDVYNNILQYCNDNNITCTFNLSFHDSQVSFDEFFNKLENIKYKKQIAVEFVVNDSNYELLDKVKDKCKYYGVRTIIDNERDKTGSLLYNTGENTPTSKFGTYSVIENDKTTHFNKKSDIINYCSGINSYDKYCSASYTHILIEDNNIYNNACSEKQLIGNLNKLTLDRKIYHCKKLTPCTLCGNISIDYNKNRLKNTLNINET